MIYLTFIECLQDACHGVPCLKSEEDSMKNVCSSFCPVYNPEKQTSRKSDVQLGNEINLPRSHFSSLLLIDTFVLLVEVSLDPSF